MSNELTIKDIRSLAELEIHADAWDELAERMPHHLPVDSYAWISSYLEHRLNPGEEWCCLIAYEGSVLIGVLPLIISSQKVLGISKKIFRSPGDGHTRSVNLLITPGKEEQVCQSLLSSLNKVEPNWFLLYLERIPTYSPIIKYINDNPTTVKNYQEFFNVGSFITTTGTNDEFLASLKSKFRTNLKSRAKRLNQYENVSTEFLIGEDATEADLERFINIEVLGWKGRVGSAIVQTPVLIEFYKTLVKKLAKRGWLEWHFLNADGKTIAGNFCVRCGATMVLCKLGYDEKYSKCSPGTLLFELEAKYAIESDYINQIDLISDPPWARDWQMKKQEYNNLWVYSPGFLSYVRGYLPKKIRKALSQIAFLKKIVRSVRSLFKKSDSK